VFFGVIFAIFLTQIASLLILNPTEMKKIVYYSVCLLAFSFAGTSTFAFETMKKEKKSKEEKKAEKNLEKEMKKMDPMAFKAMYEEWQILKGEVPALKRQAEGGNSELNAIRSRITETQAAIEREKQNCQDQLSKINTVKPSKAGPDFTKGTVLHVQVGQIGAYNSPGNLEGVQVDEDGAVKYTFGYFKIDNPTDKAQYDQAYADADRLKTYLRKMGVKHASIIVYVDNQRANIKDIVSNLN